MPDIPSKIDGVTLEFAASVNKSITDELYAAMTGTITTNAVAGQVIEKLWISSARDSHNCPSRHVTGNGIDISRVNGKHISVHYTSDASIKAIVDGLQTKFESAPKRRENFGPTIKKKLGKDHAVTGHKDHFHWSVDGDHSECDKNLLEKFLGLFRRKSSPDTPEICNI